MRLNDPGQSNGIQEFWIDGKLEANRNNLDFVVSYTAYGINAIFFENFWNDGSPKQQERYFDNIVVSTERIGCLAGAPPISPTDLQLKAVDPLREDILKIYLSVAGRQLA